jgi:ABC transporter substrate binding protein
MKRSEVVLSVILAIVLLAVSVPSDAQQPGKVYRIGQLWGSAPPSPANTSPQQCPIRGWPSWQAFLERLREYGYLLGQNLVIECRYAEGQAERASALATELVRLTPDLIVAGGWSHNILAAKQATRTIPILMVTASDPVGRGFVASLAHPGGNVTGLTDTVGVEFVGKQLQILKEAVPTASRMAYLYSPAAIPLPAWGTEREAAARAGSSPARRPTGPGGNFELGQRCYVHFTRGCVGGAFLQPLLAFRGSSRHTYA